MKLLRNFLYNVGYQVLIIIVPVILAPYLSRIVGPEGIGTYSYTYSIVTLFGLLANLGIAKYGNREIAKCGNDREKRSQIFAELLSVKFCCGLVTLIIYILFVTFFTSEYQWAFFIQTLNLLSFILEISWMFWGMQEFRVTAAVCTVMKVLSVFLIFAFVKTEEDTGKYILILASNALLIQAATWGFLRKYIDLKYFLRFFINRHWKNILLLFFPVVAKYLYSTMDRIMLGNIVGITEVGYYENVQSIVMTFIYVLTAIGDVVLPRMTQLWESREKKKREKLFDSVFHLISFLAVGGMFGFIGVADQFIPWFYGENFRPCILLLKMISPVLVFAGYADLVRSIFLLPRYRDREYVTALICGAALNFIVNFMLIPQFRSAGAVIGTVAAEALVFSIQLWFVRKEADAFSFLKKAAVYCAMGMVILVSCKIIEILFSSTEVILMLDIIVGGGLYALCTGAYLCFFQKHVFDAVKEMKKR